jgi:hypothetical protein
MYVPIDDDDDDNEQNGNKNDEVGKQRAMGGEGTVYDGGSTYACADLLH